MSLARCVTFLSFAWSVLTSSLAPNVLPLIVRNPYLSTWLPNAREEPWSSWPMFWNGQKLGLSVLARTPYDRTVYPLLGRPQDSLKDPGDWTGDDDDYIVSRAIYRGAQYDASTTNLSYAIVGADSIVPTEITLSFLSPITPTSTFRQSLPASYLTIHLEGNTDVEIYVDVNGAWVSGSPYSAIKWREEVIYLDREDNNLVTFSISREEEKLYEETDDMAEWGTLHFTGRHDSPRACGPGYELREKFAKSGPVSSSCSHGSGHISHSEPAFAFMQSFNLSAPATNQPGSVASSATFTIAHVQESIVQYASARGLTDMRPLWKSYFGTCQDMLTFHYFDHVTVSSLARNYSEQLRTDAIAYLGSDYADVLALSARQVLGATSFSGTPENPLLFLKEISSNGNCQTVDVIFPSFPFFLYTSPRWLAYLLEPLLEHQLSGQYPNKYSMHDLGAHFPNMTGHADGKDEYMPLEECGDMLIMALALVQSLKSAGSPWAGTGTETRRPESVRTSDTPFSLSLGIVDGRWVGSSSEYIARHWLARSYKLLKQWTSYLVEFALEPHNQLSTDDFAGWLALHSNLALKGIIGIRAMSELADILGYDGDVKHYRNISDTYVKKWQEYAVANDGTHVKLAYDWQGSWTTLYSLYADSMLCFHPGSQDQHVGGTGGWPANQQALTSATNTGMKDFIPHELYTNQSLFYSQILQRYGLPLDSRHRYAKSDWMFEAAAVMDPELEREIHRRHAKWVNNTNIDRPLSDLFETEDEDGGWGGGVRFLARPVVGGHWAGLALERACGGDDKRAR